MADDPKTLASTMIGVYGEGAEVETRAYANRLRLEGRRDQYLLWMKVADIVSMRQKLVKSLDS